MEPAPFPGVPGVPEGTLTLHGRVMPASNATFVGEVDGVRVVYKPISGERPLWDFPDGSLAGREVASALVSEALGWRVVPPTVLRDGPHGPGMVQLWCEPDPGQEAVDLVEADAVPQGYCHVLDGLDALDQPVALVHERSDALRRMALFDVVTNNSDRKGGHVLAMADGHRYGVDHGLTFHTDPKLRTVLWGWAGEPVPADDLTRIARLADQLEGELGEELTFLVTVDEVAAAVRRCRRLAEAGVMPVPDGRWPAIPWPPF
ncbi:phosphatidylinositol kinase [Nocardioides daphniae]|uniref:Phosphatidylinositol kinase n=2 Tax=Nocardioides daphniae TaxID=402297 RepID=A0ABQ1QGD3_9ACTN|nr:SCO1664 family protein [Nocardioides daphniae]GGD25686.1 phosphatidylinositol kinase [Nocardioides daphniae]